MEFRVVGPGDEDILVELFAHVDATFFRPHPFTAEEARLVCGRRGRDLYAVLIDDGRAVAYGMLRGWDEGYAIPALGIAVGTPDQGRGFGRRMMEGLHCAAAERGVPAVRLRVHEDNRQARTLYESLGYTYQGEERGELVMTKPLGPAEAVPVAPAGVTLIRPDDPSWDVALARTPHSVFHTAGYHRYASGFAGGQAFLALIGDARRGLAWPYLLRAVPDLPGGATGDATDVGSVYGYPGPIAWGCGNDDPFVREALALVVETWRSQHAVSAFTRFNPLLANERLALGDGRMPPGVTGEGVHPNGQTVSVDLTLGDSEVLAGYRRDLARRIARGRKAGLVTIHDETWGRLSEFSALYQGTMERLGASDFYFFGHEAFHRLHASLPESCHLLVTLLGDEVAAAGLFFEHQGVVEWHLVGSIDDLAFLSPSKVLVDDAIRWARARGNRVLHMGGGRGGRDDSLFWFKGGFSPRRELFFTGRWVLDGAGYDRLVVATHAGLPDGADIDQGFFPAYRAPRQPLVPDTAPAEAAPVEAGSMRPA